jgi:Mg2+-importing ATPase
LGIRMKLVTGDSRHVAAKIAAEAGFGTEAVLTGGEFRDMSRIAQAAAVERYDVFAEMDPNQKESVIAALKRAGHSVGFLGDGINDAASLHTADVGISVDSAVDVTKQAADIVLLRKDLGVLADGVREGRRAFSNTLKYLFITTSANFGNMFSMAGASLFAAFLPMLPGQILLLNVLSDLPAMAIASDRTDAEMTAAPRKWNLKEIQRFMLVFGLISSSFDFLTFGSLLWLRVEPGQFRTAWFLESVLSELLILLVIRTRRWSVRSPVGKGLLGASAVVAGAAVAIPYAPFAGLLGFAPLPLHLMLLVFGILTGYVLVSEFAKGPFFRLQDRAALRHSCKGRPG